MTDHDANMAVLLAALDTACAVALVLLGVYWLASIAILTALVCAALAFTHTNDRR